MTRDTATDCTRNTSPDKRENAQAQKPQITRKPATSKIKCRILKGKRKTQGKHAVNKKIEAGNVKLGHKKQNHAEKIDNCHLSDK